MQTRPDDAERPKRLLRFLLNRKSYPYVRPTELSSRQCVRVRTTGSVAATGARALRALARLQAAQG